MISPDEFLAYLCKVEGGTVAVDLQKVLTGPSTKQAGKSHQSSSGAKNPAAAPGPKMRLALDMEDCLDRFYGGYYSDWACGGQWNRAYQFVQLLMVAFQKAQVEVTAFFDGTLRENKRWTAERIETRERTLAVLKHIRTIGTPPPKVWWMPPGGLRSALRNALRTLNIPVMQTVNDHSMEIIAYYHEQHLDGVLGLSPDYIVSNISRYFSSHDLRLSYKGTLESREFLVSKFLTNFSLTPDHLPYLAALFGGYTVLTEVLLKRIYKKLGVSYGDEAELRIKKMAEIVRNSPTNDLTEFINKLGLQEWQEELRESIEYYQRKGKFASGKIQFRKRVQIETAFAKEAASGGQAGGSGKNKASTSSATPSATSRMLEDVVALASETNENDEIARKILLDVNNLVDEADSDLGLEEPPEPMPTTTTATVVATDKSSAKGTAKGGKGNKNNGNFVYTLPSEILKTALLRHQRGMMDPRIFHLFNKKEIILPQILEDEQYREVPSVHLFYRPARQQIYAILFNLFHQRYMYSKSAKDQQKGGSKKDNAGKPEILIKEWIWSPQNEYARPELVAAEQLSWSVSTIQRLWFGMAVEDKQRRMKAFLTVMRSDTPLMMNRSFVPQHMLVLACILRYIVTNPDRSVLSHSELDAFLATAFSPVLNNVEYTQDMVLPGVNLRGVYLATLLMQGFETAALANDACGVPLPWLSTSPWLVFDGKLFQFKLKMTGCVQSLHELCDDHLETVLKIERLKEAILEDAEHFLLPDPMAFRNNYNLTGAAGGVGGMANYNNIPLPLLQSVAAAVNNGGPLGQLAGNRGQFGNVGLANNQKHNRGNRGLVSGIGGGGVVLDPFLRQELSAGYYSQNNGGTLGQSGGHRGQFGNLGQAHNLKHNRGNRGLVSGIGGGGVVVDPFLRQELSALGAAQQQQQKGHQLKVGGVVVGSWGSGYGRGPPQLAQLSTRYNQVGRGRNASQLLSNRLSRMPLDVMPQLAQYPGQGYGEAFNMRTLGGLGGVLGGGGGGYGGMGMGGGGGGALHLGKQMKAGVGGGAGGVGTRRAKNNKQAANMKKQNGKKKANQKAKKEGPAKAKTVGEKKAGVSALTESLAKNLTITEEGDEGNDTKNGFSQVLDSDLVTEMCDGVLKEDDDDIGEDDESEGEGAEGGDKNTAKQCPKPIKGQPKHILTKKKLIAIGGGSEGKWGNGGANNNKAEEAGQGDTLVANAGSA